ncbi:LysE family transporter [Plantibacter sp. M259]|uniref:LysE family transporter n=1 Tax=Plantibacter sp. M259 TaxID=2583822 RepID=UPI0011103F1C|nr:LysE family transporter [Plantibacter sp. M259]
MDVLLALLAGSVAGLAPAAPLGAIGILLLQEGVTRGLRRGLPAAAAVATVDVAYCTAAVAAGALAGPIVSGWSPWPQLLGGVAVIALGAHGLVQGLRAKPSAGERPAERSGSAHQRYLLFLGLTAINPATLVYFAAILTGLAEFTESGSTAVAFIVGVGLASFSWQALLVALGAGIRRRTGASFRRWTAIVGNGLIVAFGVALIIQAL